MGSKSGGAVRKLQDIAKRRAMKFKLGNQESVAARGKSVPHAHAKAMLYDALGNRKIPGKGYDPEIEPKEDKADAGFVLKEYKPLPKKAGYVIRPFKPRGGCYSGCYLKK